MEYSEGDYVILENIQTGHRNVNRRLIGEVIEVTGRTVTVKTKYGEKTFGKERGEEWGEGDRHSGWKLHGTIDKDHFKVGVFYEDQAGWLMNDDTSTVFNLDEAIEAAFDREREPFHAVIIIDLYGRPQWIWTSEENEWDIPTFGHQEELEN